MRLRYLLIILIACIGPTHSRLVNRNARFATRPLAARSRFESIPASVSSLPPATRACLARPASWRHRIKSVLEEKDLLSIRIVDHGPSVIPELSDRPIGSSPGLSRSAPLIPLRC